MECQQVSEDRERIGNREAAGQEGGRQASRRVGGSRPGGWETAGQEGGRQPARRAGAAADAAEWCGRARLTGRSERE